MQIPAVSPSSVNLKVPSKESQCMRVSRAAWARLTMLNIMIANTVVAAFLGRPKLVVLNIAFIGLKVLAEPDDVVGFALQMVIAICGLMEALKK
jgi:hypothetical protein